MQIKTSLRFYLTPARIAVTKKINDNKCWHGCGERGPCSSLLVGVQTGAAAVEICMESSQKLNKELCCNPDVALLGVYPEDLKLDHRNTCTFMFIATLFTIAKKVEPALMAINNQWKGKMRYVYPMGFYSAIKKNEIMQVARK